MKQSTGWKQKDVGVKGLRYRFEIFEGFESQLEEARLYTEDSQLLKCVIYRSGLMNNVSEHVGVYPRENPYVYIEPRARAIIAVACVICQNWE